MFVAKQQPGSNESCRLEPPSRLNSSGETEGWLTTQEAAEYLRIKPRTLLL